MPTPSFNSALKKALARLRSADRFEKEIEVSLRNAGFDDETAQDVVSYLKERRFVDDRRTIMNAVERRSGRRAVGKDRLRAELLDRGAPEELVDECLAALPESRASEDVEGLLQAKFGNDRAAANRVRGGRYLASRGFEPEEIEGALDRFFGSVDDGVD